jgi:hypothetical protein
VKNGRATEDPQPVQGATAGIAFVPSSWSPGDDDVAGTADGIVICSLSAPSCRRLVPSGRSPVWLPGGRSVLYLQGDSLRTADARGGEHHEVFSAAPNGLGPSLSLDADGKTVLLSLTSSDESIWKLSLRDQVQGDQGVR